MSHNKRVNIAFRIAKYVLVLPLITLFVFAGYFVITGKSLYHSISSHFARQEFLEFRKTIALKEGDIIVTNARIKDGEDNYLVYVDLLLESVTDKPLFIDLRCFRIITKNHALYNPYIVGDGKMGDYTALEISSDITNPTSVVWQFEKKTLPFEQFTKIFSTQMDVTHANFILGGCTNENISKN